MLSVLADRTYRRLFWAQIIALLGTGLATVALALLAFELAGEAAGSVLGTALAIKMIAYVTIAPTAGALIGRLPRRAVLVGLDLVRAAIALALPFVTEIWQIYVLIFALQAASAGFTPTFQATIPDILPDDADYTKALSLSRLAYDLENLISPALAGALLTVMSFHFLFAGTSVGFFLSAVLILSLTLPGAAAQAQERFRDRFTRGMRIYLATPRLRGLFAVNLGVAAGGALVIVNTVVYVQGVFGLEARQTALALASFGAGSMLAALALPPMLDRIADRTAMLAGLGVLVVSTLAATAMSDYGMLLALWCVLGIGYSLAQVPSGRLLKRSAHPDDRPAVYAAQFAFSHACWLLTYPLAGWLGGLVGLPIAALFLAAIAATSIVVALRAWPVEDPDEIAHEHPELPPDHAHLSGPGAHRHAYVIDDLHPAWPRLR